MASSSTVTQCKQFECQQRTENKVNLLCPAVRCIKDKQMLQLFLSEIIHSPTRITHQTEKVKTIFVLFFSSHQM